MVGKLPRRVSDVAQQQVGPAGRHQPRLFPDDEIVLVAVARIAGDQRQGHSFACRRRRHLEPHLLPRDHGVTGSSQAFGPPTLPIWPTRAEFPQLLLPGGDVACEHRGTSGVRGPPRLASAVEEQRRSGR